MEVAWSPEEGEWSFVTPLTDPTFIMTNETPATVRYLRNAHRGWLPLFNAFMNARHPGLVNHVATIEHYERRHRESFFSDAGGVKDMFGQVKDSVSVKNAYQSVGHADEKEKKSEELAAYEDAVEALAAPFANFTEVMRELRDIIRQHGVFNVMSAGGRGEQLVAKYWQAYATATSVELQLEALNKGFEILYGLTDIAGSVAEDYFQKFRDKFDETRPELESLRGLARPFWEAIKTVDDATRAFRRPSREAAEVLDKMMSVVQEQMAAIQRTYRLASEACATWATVNADDIASKKLYLDHPAMGKLYRAVDSVLGIGIGVVRIIELDSRVITMPLSGLRAALSTAITYAHATEAWDDPSGPGDQIGKAAKFSVVGTSLDSTADAAKYGSYAATAGNALNSVDVPVGPLADEIPVVGVGLQIARGAIDLLKLDLTQVATIEDQEELKYAQLVVNSCLGSWNDLGILDFSAGVFFYERTDRGIKIGVTEKLTGKSILGWINYDGQFYSNEGNDHTISLARQAASQDRNPRHQAVDARPDWDNLTYVTREKEGSLDVFRFTGVIAFTEREGYTPVGLRLGRSAIQVGHHHQTVGEQPAVRSRDRHRHGQTFTVEVLKELGLPREISVAPGAETTDREVPVDAHAPHVVGDSASERFDASDLFTPLPECLPPHRPHLTGFRTSLFSADPDAATRHCHCT